MSKNQQNWIGIITLNDDDNYGNRLQNYALTQLLGGPSICTTIKFDVNRLSLLEYYLRPILEFLRKLISEKKNVLRYLQRLRQNKLFTKRFVPNDVFALTARKGLRRREDINLRKIVLGSDQVWNYQWLTKTDLALRLGSFVTADVPIISYAASIGVSEVDADIEPIFQKYLPRLRAISVREDRARELVGEMTGLEAVVVLDPTLMLAADSWRSITRGFVPDDDRYVLTYFLGKPSAAQEYSIQECARAYGCRIRRMLDPRDPETYVAGPQDFVELFSKAEYVFTDSYHACCFSILFHKQFTVFNRDGMKGSMNSRMETLFRLFELDATMMDAGLAPEIDYANIDRLLERHRTESWAWLDKAMEA